jgi:hypothetical protein
MWKYKDSEISSIDDMPNDVIGFVYEITHIPTGKKYIGKKTLKHKKTRPPLKGYKRKRVEYVESDWKTYYGSHEGIKELLKENKQNEFHREIIEFAKTKKYLSYLETKIQFQNSVLEKQSEYFNSNILGKWYPKDIED